MEFIHYYAGDALSKIDKILKNKDKKSFDPKNYKKAMNSLVYNLLNISTEVNRVTYGNTILDIRAREMIDKMDDMMEDVELFIESLKYSQMYLENIRSTYTPYRSSDFKYVVDNDQYKKLPEHCYPHLMSSINFPSNRPLKILDSEFFNNKSLSTIKTRYEDEVATYGITSFTEEYHSFDGIDRYIRVGENASSYVTNNAFDVVFNSTNLSTEYNTNNMFFKKKEIISIQRSIKYLRPGGAYFLIIPNFRIYADIANLLSRELEDIEILSAYNDNSDYIAVIKGVKRESKLPTTDPESYKLLRMVTYNYHKLKSLNDPLTKFTSVRIPESDKEITQFRGSVVTDNDVGVIMKSSNVLELLLNNQQILSSQYNKEPLIPFTFGQIGLVVSSGCIDGIIDEGDGNYHLVKGRTVKNKTYDSEDGDDFRSESTTERNKIEINTIFPDGTYKTLI